jgi:hypothetical protein
MKRGAMRDRRVLTVPALPDFASPHPGYEIVQTTVYS